MSEHEPLVAARHEIDRIDLDILRLLGERTQLVEVIGQIKAEAGMEAYQKDRFEELLGNVKAHALSMGLDEAMVVTVWHAIHEASLAQQNSVKLPR